MTLNVKAKKDEIFSNSLVKTAGIVYNKCKTKDGLKKAKKVNNKGRHKNKIIFIIYL